MKTSATTMDLDELETHDGIASGDEGGANDWSGFGSPSLTREDRSERGTHTAAEPSSLDSGFDWPSATEIDQVRPVLWRGHTIKRNGGSRGPVGSGAR